MFIDIRERGREGRWERQRDSHVRENHGLVALHMCPAQGSNLQPKHAPWPGMELAPPWCIGRHSNQLSHPAGAVFLFLMNILLNVNVWASQFWLSSANSASGIGFRCQPPVGHPIQGCQLCDKQTSYSWLKIHYLVRGTVWIPIAWSGLLFLFKEGVSLPDSMIWTILLKELCTKKLSLQPVPERPASTEFLPWVKLFRFMKSKNKIKEQPNVQSTS